MPNSDGSVCSRGSKTEFRCRQLRNNYWVIPTTVVFRERCAMKMARRNLFTSKLSDSLKTQIKHTRKSDKLNHTRQVSRATHRI